MKNFAFENSDPRPSSAAARRSLFIVRLAPLVARRSFRGARPSSLSARRLLSSVFVLLLAAFCLTAPASGSPPAAHYWEKQKSGTLAWLRGVFFVDGERGWAVGAKGALLSTADGGASWQTRRAPTEDALRDIFFTDERTGWIVCERSVYLPRGEGRGARVPVEDRGRRREVVARRGHGDRP